MPAKSLKILCVHGLGDQRQSGWQDAWTKAIAKAVPPSSGTKTDVVFLTYDDIFETYQPTLADIAIAAGKLALSGILGPRERGLWSDIQHGVRWTAGYVVAWVESEEFRTKTRKRVLDAIAEHRPDVVLAHSLGSLVTYNAFSHPDASKVADALGDLSYVTFGSQIGNPFVVRNLTTGRVTALPVRFWHHLYNVHDDVFTAEISIPGAANFRQTYTPFDIDGILDHSATAYITAGPTLVDVWDPIIGGLEALVAKALAAPARAAPRKKQKALLVGINDYPDPANRLQGCVNDVFTMSAVLQDCGMPAESIRVCLDDRATRDGILERLAWLLDDPQPEDELVFYYSGHGAKVPQYGPDDEPDHQVETLVPWDFNWEPETFISDDQIWSLYSQLPYDTRFFLILDCCHSGGMHRDGGGRPRGIDPPDDIRHRALKWDSKAQMWVARDFQRINAGFTDEQKVAAAYFGKDGSTRRIGRAGALRGLSEHDYKRARKSADNAPVGPYLPLIIEACGEDEYSYEYRHGAESHGAFTFCLAKNLRDSRRISFDALVRRTAKELAELRYQQTPQILGPSVVREAIVPWRRGQTSAGGSRQS